MTIREATGVDLAAIDDIYNHYVQTSTATFQVHPTTPEERRAWFAAHGPEHPVIVFEDEVTDHVLREPFSDLREAELLVDAGIENGVGKRRRHQVVQLVSESSYKAGLLATALSSRGSSKTAMVGAPGFEPGTSASRTLRANQAALHPAGISRSEV